MATESLRMSVVLSASPADVYRAWLDAKEHGAFTGSPAEVNPVIGGRHSAWDGYITGQNLELDPARRIVQSWRTTEFPPEAADSRLRLTLNAVEEGTELLIEHDEIPEGQGRAYEQGWVEYYFEPMKRHFSKRARPAPVLQLVQPLAGEVRAGPKPAAPKKKAAPKKAVKKSAPKKAVKKAAPKKKAAAPKKLVKKAAPKKKAAAPKKLAKKAAPKKKAVAKKEAPKKKPAKKKR